MMDERKTHYETLKIEESASDEEITRQFRKLAKKLHPDNGSEPDEHRFKKVSAAYAELGSNRVAYDAGLAGERAQAEAARRAAAAREARRQRAPGAADAKAFGDRMRGRRETATSQPPPTTSGPRTSFPLSSVHPPVTPTAERASRSMVGLALLALVVFVASFVLGAIVGGSHPGDHLKGNPFVIPVLILLVTLGLGAAGLAARGVRQGSFVAWWFVQAIVIVLAYMLGILVSHGGHFPSTVSSFIEPFATK
jgi:DnaJ domain